MTTTGIIFNLQRYSLHDGPGIRTTVFFKGCPLSCAWCHNPESLKPEIEILFHGDRCLKCGWCVQACPRQAISLDEKHGWRRDRRRCNLCGACATACPAEAIEQVGREMTVADVMAVVERDQVFYNESGGGVTLSGGEPLMQPEFAVALLAACRARGIATAVDTSGMAAWPHLERAAAEDPLFLYDVKHLDSGVHRQWTGVPNEPILDNLARLSAGGARIELRIPLVPGINDSESHLRQLVHLAARLRIRRLSLLPYHRTALGKHAKLGYEYRLNNVEEPAPESVAALAAKLAGGGVEIGIGG